MTQLINVEQERRDKILTDAADRCVHAVISHRLDSGWMTYKSRILQADSAGEYLILAHPLPEPGQAPPELAPGERIGLSFRRGHKKCMCSVDIISLEQVEVDDGQSVQAFKVPWPESLQEMQRRLYYRAMVPAGRRIEVRLWDGGALNRDDTELNGLPNHAGLLQDVSAGGCRVIVEANRDPQLEAGDTIGIRFQPDPRSNPLKLDAVFRHCEDLGNGKLSLGFQFVGLETTSQGCSMLQALSRVVSTFLRIEIRKKNKRTQRTPRQR